MFRETGMLQTKVHHEVSAVMKFNPYKLDLNSLPEEMERLCDELAHQMDLIYEKIREK